MKRRGRRGLAARAQSSAVPLHNIASDRPERFRRAIPNANTEAVPRTSFRIIVFRRVVEVSETIEL